MYHMSLLRSLGRYFATHSTNIPRLRRSGIKEFANSILFTGRTWMDGHLIDHHLSFCQLNLKAPYK
jgi:hypothetical protein